jgi:hypothetical protein
LTSTATTPGRAASAAAPPPSGVWLPWEALTRPAAAFAALAGNANWLPGLAGQYALFLAGAVIAAPGNADLVRVIKGVPGHAPLGPLHLLELLGGMALLTLVLNGAFAGLLLAAFRLVGFYRPYRHYLAYCSLLLLPLALGQALGQVLFALALPLSNNPADVLAWQFRPYSAGLATWLPQPPPALSLPWALYSGFDLFGLWALALGWIGIGRMLDAPRAQASWLRAVLLLVYAAVVVALWQLSQAWMAAVKTG